LKPNADQNSKLEREVPKGNPKKEIPKKEIPKADFGKVGKAFGK
jgi:hypothetical protein